MSKKEYSTWPRVLGDDEAPFVLGFDADHRPAKEVGGVQFRRGRKRYRVDVPVGDLWLRAFGVKVDDESIYLLASAGSIFTEWWPALQRGGFDSSRPCLSAGVGNSPVIMRSTDFPSGISVRILAPSDWLPGVAAVVGLGSGFSDETITSSNLAMLAVMKAALLTYCEYSSLVHEIPLANVQTDAGLIQLSEHLSIAQQVADAIDWVTDD